METEQIKNAFYRAMDESRAADEISDLQYRMLTLAADEMGDDSWQRLYAVVRRLVD